MHPNLCPRQATVFPRLESRMQSARTILEVLPAKTISSSAGAADGDGDGGLGVPPGEIVGEINLETTCETRNYR